MNRLELTNVIPCVHLAGCAPHPRVGRLVPEEIARRAGLVPLDVEGNRLVVACANPRDRQALWDVSNATRMILKPVWAPYPEIRTLLDRIYDCPEQPPAQPTPAEMLRCLGRSTPTPTRKKEMRGSRPVELAGETDAGDSGIDPDVESELSGWRKGLPHFRPQSLAPQVNLAALISRQVAYQLAVVPLWWVGGSLLIAVPDNHQGELPDFLPGLPKIPLIPVLCSRFAWERLYRSVYLQGGTAPGFDEAASLRIMARKGQISELDLEGIQTISRQDGRGLVEIGLENRMFNREQWLVARSQIYGVPYEPLHSQRIDANLDPEALDGLLPEGLARRLRVVPLGRSGDYLSTGLADPSPQHIRVVETVTGLEVQPRLVDEELVDQRLDRLYRFPRGPRLHRIPRLDELLVVMGLVTPAQIEEALGPASLPTESLEDTLLRLDLLDEEDLAEALSVQSGIPNVSLSRSSFDEELIHKVPGRLLSEHLMLPLLKVEGDLWVAVADPFDGTGMVAIERETGLRVWPLVAPRSEIVGGLERVLDQQVRALSPAVRGLVQTFVARGWLSQFEAAHALRLYSSGAQPIDRALVISGKLSEEQVVQHMSEALKLPRVDLQLLEEQLEVIDPLGGKRVKTVIRDPVNPNAARLIDLATAQRFVALPIRQVGDLVTIVFAAPPGEQALTMLESLLKRKVIASLATRSSLEEAIQRVLGRQTLGTRLLFSGIINRKQLNDALDLATRTGVRIGRALVTAGLIKQDLLYKFLADQSGLPYWPLELDQVNPEVVRLAEAEDERRYGILPLEVDSQRVRLALTDPFNEAALEYAQKQFPDMILDRVLITETDLERALEYVYSQDYLARSIFDLLARSPEDSAHRVLSQGQILFLAIALLASLAWIFFDFLSFFIVLNILSTIFYLAFSAYKVYLIYQAMTHDLEIPVTEEDVQALEDRDLPVYTVLIPVYREAEVLPDLIESLMRLDYPATKLDIKVLMEADDDETIDAFHKLSPPAQFQPIIVPYAHPKTKPKACNYGLIHARGDYVVIFDAEDLPERDQLKKVLVGFSRSAPEVICIQTKLNYYNRNQNLLTRWFTVEYSMWFDLFLPGLDASKAPIPLGGTSNHFKREALIEAGAWDPYNVTEDADLGVRVFKRGYRTAIVDSTTYEEANSQIYNWIRQRSRWIKGYMQTWLVHMRHPLKLIQEIGFKGFLSFQFVVGGTFFTALINPVYWLFTTLWFLTRWDFIESLYPGLIFFVGALCLYIGNFAFTYMNVAGAMRRGYYDMVKYALLSPLYWGMMSLAAWRGFLQLLWKPHFWEKTVHGLYQAEASEDEQEEPEGTSPAAIA